MVHARRYKRFGALIALLLFGAAGASAGPELDADEVLVRTQRWLDGTVDLQGPFEQAIVSGALDMDLEEHGVVYVARPGRMRWEYLDPEHKIAIVDGKRTWLYLEEDRELILGRLEEAGRLFPALLAGGERLVEWFERPELLATPARNGAGAYLVQLRPREAASDAVEEAILRVRPPDFSIEAAEIVDPTGNRVRYGFGDLRRNRGVDPAMFTFEPPDGTIVSGEH